MVKQGWRVVLSALAAGVIFTATTPLAASGKSARAPRPARAIASEAPKPRKLWTRKLAGLITDLDVSRDGSAILISSAPNRELAGGSRSYLLQSFDARGRMRWQKEPDSPIKAQAVSADGSLAVLAAYDGRLRAIAPRARAYRELWSVEASCRPFLLNAARKILCFNDDDQDPALAFQVFDWEGRKLLSYSVARDALEFALSGDEKSFAVALTGGLVILFDSGFRPLWQGKLGGEISALDVSSGAQPRVAVLFNEPKSFRQKWLILDPLGDSRGREPEPRSPSARLNRLRFEPDSRDSVLGFGVGAEEQFVISASLAPEERALRESWRKTEPRSADCQLLAELTGIGAVLGSEPLAEGPRHPGVVFLDGRGRTLGMLPVGGEEGACLYAHSFASDAGMLAMALDDGTFSAFGLQDPR
ncbi:MAG: hypothetical protein NDJ89_00345 [Oligoflexia bacterium]|nr:hypothetical protein [Oligoflexia bacterium]